MTGVVNAQAALVDHLAPAHNHGARKQAHMLTHRLRGLLNAPSGLREAVIAYNAFVDASSTEFLTAPPPEFLAIQAALEMLVNTRLATVP